MNLCSISECVRRVEAKGICGAHRKEQKRRAAGVPEKIRGLCTVETCGRPHAARGFCHKHYNLHCKYSLTASDMTHLVPGVKCFLCPNEASYVDHSHQEGHKRAYVCPGCNILLGQIEADDLDRVRRAIDYLDQDAKNPGINWEIQFGGSA